MLCAAEGIVRGRIFVMENHIMQVLVHTDNHIVGREDLVTWVQAEAEGSLDRFGRQITKVDIYLADENSHKNSVYDKKCTVEAHVAGMKSIAVSKQADSLNVALDQALESMVLTLDSKLGRARDPKGRPSFGGEPAV